MNISPRLRFRGTEVEKGAHEETLRYESISNPSPLPYDRPLKPSSVSASPSDSCDVTLQTGTRSKVLHSLPCFIAKFKSSGFHRKFNTRWILALLLIESFLSCLIIRFVPYTEIDWKAYMQEVAGFLDGERNYYNLKGDTGPLVYPAGFVYIFSGLRYLTLEDPAIAQILFAGFYVLQVALVLCIYASTAQKNRFLLSLVILSKRLHSIYILRCFNDGVAMIFAYASIFVAQRRQWAWCCVLYSIGVSIKMNVLLFAPGLLWLLWEEASHKRMISVIGYLSLCALVQVILGAPFLLHNPIAYIHRSFELTRVFQYKWTVNWRFVPEYIFLSKAWGIALLIGHLTVLAFLWKRVWVRNRSIHLPEEVFKTYVAFVFFSCNFVGIIFARSLHYQFYSWYFPSIPFFLCHVPYGFVTKIILFCALEFCWNVYPQRPAVSAVLLLTHIALLMGIVSSPLKDLWRREFLRSNSTTQGVPARLTRNRQYSRGDQHVDGVVLAQSSSSSSSSSSS